MLTSLQFESLSREDAARLASLFERVLASGAGKVTWTMLASRAEAGLAAPTRRGGEALLGALRHLGKAPTAEAIDDARRETWGSFPRDDVS